MKERRNNLHLAQEKRVTYAYHVGGVGFVDVSLQEMYCK